ncbi:MAG: precorrin-8X methylmutase [Rhizobiaceae bacterium]|nr:precorrin-8X methylmutase [Rhizobiaceae bacterium]
MAVTYHYIRQPAEIYRRSFAIVREEAGLSALPASVQPIATRLIHSCGMVDVIGDLSYSAGAAEAGREALQRGATVYCDVEMVRSGIIKSRLPADNQLLCTLNDPRTPELARQIDNTRSAAAVDLWDEIEGAVIAIGNAPTALFALLENIQRGRGMPALVIGIPVGFVGAVESKLALAEFGQGLNYITVHGRRGGSAMASAVVNALAAELEQ